MIIIQKFLVIKRTEFPEEKAGSFRDLMPAPSEPLALQESKPYWETQKSFGPWAFLFLWASQEMTGGEVPSLTRYCPNPVKSTEPPTFWRTCSFHSAVLSLLCTPSLAHIQFVEPLLQHNTFIKKLFSLQQWKLSAAHYPVRCLSQGQGH